MTKNSSEGASWIWPPDTEHETVRRSLFRHAFTPQPLCGPARACLQSGLYATQTGCFNNGHALPLDQPTIAKLLSGPQLSTAGDVGMRVLGSVGDVLMTLLGVTVTALLTPIYAFLLLLALPRWRSALPNYLPQDQRALWLRIGGRIVASISALVRGRVVVCSIVGAITAIGWALLGVRLGILAGLGVGALTLVPLANVLVLVPVLVMSVIECATGARGWGWLLGVLGIYAVGQLAESVLNPLIVGDAVELDLLTMIVALTIGGALAGFAGLVLAVPVAATLRILAEELWLPRWRAWAENGSPAP